LVTNRKDVNTLILLEKNPPVAILTLNRPQRHNSLVPELLKDLLAALEDLQMDSQIRAVVLQANGRSFSTGGDLRGFYDHLDDIEAYAGEIVGLLNQVILGMVDLPVPVVAAVHGIVTGGSLGLVLASDIVLVTSEVSFTPYYNMVGFSPDGGWTAWLPQIIGPKRTAQILMQNATISAEQAVAWGLANHLVPREETRTQALETAQDIAAKQFGSIRQTKRLLYPADLAERLETERRHFIEQIKTQETEKSMIAFLEKMGL
jgi:2-(1,2-epoxy-1,2-dihydrophenyl)acetyl-CoA isomerase